MVRKPIDERIGQFKDVEDDIRGKWRRLSPVLDERQRRLWAAAEVSALPTNGASIVHRATGLGLRTIRDGIRDLKQAFASATAGPQKARIRRVGGGRKRSEVVDPSLIDDLDALVEPTRRGDPESPLRWTTKSLRHLASVLQRQGHRVSPTKVGELLKEQGYSMQAPSKAREGLQHPDRDKQFHHINDKVKAFQTAKSPVVSVDTKKKELVGNFQNGGSEWHSAGAAPVVDVHDFPSDAVGKAIPYGVYDIARKEAHVNVGVDHDTPTFAAASLRAWWRSMGRRAYPGATEILVVADAGGSNAYRSRIWKLELQDFATETGLTINVCHFPPGTSKWNHIEHRLFSAISTNWRGQPLRTFETVVKLIAGTRTSAARRVRARLDRNEYPTGLKVSAATLAAIAITRDEFHGEWNYTIAPKH